MPPLSPSTQDPFHETGLGYYSGTAPSLVGSDLYGQAVVWADIANSPCQINFSSCSPGSTTWSALTTIGSWSDDNFTAATTFASPAIAAAWDWPAVCIAWVDSETSNVYITGDAGQTTVTYTTLSTNSNPVSMVYGDGQLYLGWIDYDSSGDPYFYCGTYDQVGDKDFANTGIQIPSGTAGPTLTWYGGVLYALFGGDASSGNTADVLMYGSYDQGQSFAQYSLADTLTSSWPPYMAVQDGLYVITYPGTDLQMNVITTTDPSADLSNQTTYQIGCHSGIPVIMTQGQINISWIYGIAPPNPRLHQVFTGTIPLTLGPITASSFGGAAQ